MLPTRVTRPTQLIDGIEAMDLGSIAFVGERRLALEPKMAIDLAWLRAPGIDQHHVR